MAASICRLCLGKAIHPHYTVLFTRRSLEKDLPSRISKLVGIPVCKGDGYPEGVCRSCMDKFNSLEKGLNQFRDKAVTSHRTYSSRKHPTESRQSPNTPTTDRSHPPPKRSRARCLFPDDGEFASYNN